MKKTIYLLLILLTARHSLAIQKTVTSLIVASTLVVESKHQEDRSLALNDLDEEQVLSLIIKNYAREASIKTCFSNDLKGLINRFFIDEWAIDGLNKNTGTAYDPHSFDIRGIHKETKSGLDLRGFRQNGYYKDVDPETGKLTKYNPERYDIDRWRRDGLHENGSRVDDNGFAQYVGYASVALYKATKDIDVKAVSLLLKQPGINVNVQDIDGITPLIVCCDRGDEYLEIAKLLLNHAKIDVNIKDIDGNTPLIACCDRGDKSLGVAKCLLKRPEIDVNLQNDIGDAPLTWCCIAGDKSLGIAKSLLAFPSLDVNLQNNNGSTPLDMIIGYGVLQNNESYTYVKLWNAIVAKGAILNEWKEVYDKLNPNNFNQPHRGYVRLIKRTSPKNHKVAIIPNKFKMSNAK